MSTSLPPWGRTHRFLLLVVAGAMLSLGATSSAEAAPAPASAGSSTSTPASLPTLAVAEQEADDLGPVAPSTLVSMTLTLKTRNTTALQTLVDEGGRVTPEQWVAQFGPPSNTFAALHRLLGLAGFESTWTPGDDLVSATGPAISAERLFHLDLHYFVLDHTMRFYAPLTVPTVPTELVGQVTAVTGLDDYRGFSVPAIPRPESGLSPSEISHYYDATPLRKAGLDGAGMTVMFIEEIAPSAAALSSYAAKFGLPPFAVKVHTDPNVWGPPATASNPLWANFSGEAAMDVEIVHGLAPAAREVVYVDGYANAVPQMVQTMVTQNPGAILSASYTMGCEAINEVKGTELAFNAVAMRAAAEGTSIFYATGDRGAFQCLNGGSASAAGLLSIDAGAASPYVTAVGGTSAFFSSKGNYYKEAVWGEPLETWGSGGGFSTAFKQPSYQVAPGLGRTTLSGRGVPDVACDADPDVSGWDIFTLSSPRGGVEEGASGGTSAATPCWAAMTALIDEDLKEQALPEIGFANPALYDFSRDPVGMPATPFHIVTEGSNLHYLAAAGWTAASGLGTPDVAHLADDFEWYERSKR